MTKTYRDIFKWGNPDFEETIDPILVEILQERLDFKPQPIKDRPGNNAISETFENRLPNGFVEEIQELVGDENISTNTQDIMTHAHGKSYVDVLKEREHQFENRPDAIVYPTSDDEIEKLLGLCQENDVAVVPVGGMSSVTEGIAYPNGGICLDLTKHLNEVIDINIEASTATVQAGMMGPDFEEYLQDYAVDGITGYTCGHFPQSFEYSTIGGWVATRGAGQESTGYGKIEDMVLGLKIVTPSGTLELPTYPAKALGPELLQVIIGSEGAFGVITEVTMKIRRKQLHNEYGAFLVKSWQDGINAVREIMQQRGGKPFLFRLSDPEESEIYLKIADFAGWKEWILDKLGYKEGSRVLLLVSTSGDGRHARSTMKYVRRIVKSNEGRYVGSSPVEEWLQERFETPYLRDTLMDQGILIDTLETATTWDNIYSLWKNVRAVIKNHGKIICMTHLSHMYENGANLYFIFITKEPDEDRVATYQKFQTEIIQAIIQNGGSLSHHHGIGRLFGNYLQEEIGELGIKIIESIKSTLDPKNIMNPGVLGLHQN